MIVDDHAGVRKMIRHLVAAPGDTVMECATGDEAISTAREFRPDFVTMDVRMPGTCGFEAARSIRGFLPDTRIIMVTSYDQPFLRQTAGEVGAVGYVVKDNLEELRTVVAREMAAGAAASTPEIAEVLPTLLSELDLAQFENELSANIAAHDLSGSLEAIRAATAELERAHAIGRKTRDQQAPWRSYENCQRLGACINGLLDLARAAQVPLKWETVNMGGLLQEVVAGINPEPARRRIGFKLEGLPEVCGDRELLRLVLQHLLANAVRFSARRERPAIEVGCSLVGSMAVFFVRDNGPGFDMSDAGRLFQPFCRLHAEEAYKGTGLGLAVVRRVMQRHGCRVWAEAAREQGATFYFTLLAAAPGRAEES